MSHTLARAIVALRWPIVLAWIAAAILATRYLPTIADAQQGALGALVAQDAPALKAEQHAHALFGFPLLSRTILVQRDPNGLSSAVQAQVLQRAARIDRHRLPGFDSILGAYPLINTLGKPPFSRESGTTALTFLFIDPSLGASEHVALARRLARQTIPHGHFAGITGEIAAEQDLSTQIADHLGLITGLTVLLVLIAVGVHFRALGAPLANLVAVGIAYLVAVRLVAQIGKAVGLSIPSEVQPVVIVLLFGVMTDYAIFFLDRFRGRLAAGDDAHEAVVRTTAELLPIVFVCGLTVVLANAALLVAKLGFFRAFGPGVAFSVLIGLIVALTFIPAVLAIVGPWLYWPSRPSRTPALSGGGGSSSWSIALAVRRRLPVLVVCLALLVAAATGIPRLALGSTLIRGLPGSSPALRAYEAASQGFAPGVLAPTVVLVSGAGVAHERAGLARLQAALRRQPGVAAVAGPASNRTPVQVGPLRARSGNAARFVVYLEPDPLGAVATDRVRTLSDRLPALLRAAGLSGARAQLAGDTALFAETVNQTLGDLGRVIPVMLGVVFVILVIFLRGVVVPALLVIAAALGPAAAVGLSSRLFQDELGFGTVTYYVPVATAVLLVSLGSDYNVFLVGRIWSEARRREMREAILVGGGAATRAISAAGLVLAGSFALLAIVPLRAFRELAFTMAVGLVIDAFLVRTFLVPAVLALLGRHAGGPSPPARPAGRRARQRRRVAAGVAGDADSG